MRINNNIMALNTHRQYSIANSTVGESAEKLSSGFRINRAGDDAAGLAISEKMRAQIRGLNMASKNSQDAISLVQTAEGALQETHNILQRMRELAVQSASDTNETVVDRGALQQEFSQLISELDDTASKTKFNDQGLLDGTFAKSTTTASSAGANHNMSWANSNVAAGTYTITAGIVDDQAAVTGVGATVALKAGSATATSTAGTMVLTHTGFAAGAGAKSDTINGSWNFTMSDGKIVATNQRTGEQMSREFAGVAGGDDVEIDFGDLGTFKIANSSTSDANADSFTGFSATVNVTLGVADKTATYKHVATLGNDQIVLETGMTTLDFKNSGISVNLKNALSVDSNSNTLLTADVDGVVTVAKNQGKNLVIQTGANQHDELQLNIDKMDAYTLGVKSANIANRLDASVAITQVNTALNHVSTQRAALGALQNRLTHKIANLDTSAENMQAAESRIRDVDMAKEMTAFTKKNILVQAATAMLAQANQAPQNVLQLLR